MSITYDQFKATNKYDKAFSGAEVTYIIYLETNTALKPIGRGSDFSVDGAIEQIPVEEYGVEIVREYADGKYTLTGRFGTFFIPSQEDKMPNTQNFRGKEYIIDQVCAGIVAGKIIEEYTYTDENGVDIVLAAGDVISLDGLILKRWKNVKFSGKGLTSGARGLIGINASFVASREFSGDEVAQQIDII